MVSISNDDYKKAVRLLTRIATADVPKGDLRQLETRRQARLLLWKWKNCKNRRIAGERKEDI